MLFDVVWLETTRVLARGDGDGTSLQRRGVVWACWQDSGVEGEKAGAELLGSWFARRQDNKGEINEEKRDEL